MNLEQCGSKVNLAMEYINSSRGDCTIEDYRKFIRRDKTYSGSFNGCEFYTAARSWRAARRLPPISQVNKYNNLDPLKVSHGLDLRPDLAQWEKRTKKLLPILEGKWKAKQADRKELFWKVMSLASESTIVKELDGTVRVTAVFGPDKK